MLAKLSPKELDIVFQCLKASLEGPFFPQHEFHSLFGITRNEVEVVIKKWPEIDMKNPNDRASVLGSLNNLLVYPHGMESILESYISASLDELDDILDKIG